MSAALTIVKAVPTYTYRNGEMIEIPDTVVVEDTEIHNSISNSLIIRPGVTVITFASVSGTIQVMSRATLDARGPISGTVSISDGARVNFHDAANGTITVDRGAVVHLLPGSVALGAIHLEGTLVNEGVRGINVTGNGTVEDREGSMVRRPDRTLPDGTTIYES